MRLEKINLDEDYPEFVKWWESYDFPSAAPKSILSVHYGLKVTDGSRALVAGWLYPAIDARIAWVGWLISNRQAEKEERSQAIDMLLVGLESLAYDSGIEIMYTPAKVPSLMKRLEKLGHIPCDMKTNLFAKVVQESKHAI
jgi:hypothetical protein